jgi:hypothetical protein
VAEPNHLRVELPTTAWQVVVHGPQYRQPPQGFANGQLWLSPEAFTRAAFGQASGRRSTSLSAILR